MLVPCKQCGASVSDQALRCPQCGLDQPTDATAETSRPSPKGGTWVAPLMIIVVIAVGAAGVGAYEIDRRASADWQNVYVHSEEPIRRFIATHPVRFNRDAEAALARLQIEEQRYSTAMAANNLSDLESYIQEFPDGHRAPLVRDRIAELRRPPDPCRRANLGWNTSVSQSCEIWDLQLFVSEVDRTCPVRALAQRRLQALRTEQEWRPIPGTFFTRPQLTGCVYN